MVYMCLPVTAQFARQPRPGLGRSKRPNTRDAAIGQTSRRAVFDTPVMAPCTGLLAAVVKKRPHCAGGREATVTVEWQAAHVAAFRPEPRPRSRQQDRAGWPAPERAFPVSPCWQGLASFVPALLQPPGARAPLPVDAVLASTADRERGPEFWWPRGVGARVDLSLEGELGGRTLQLQREREQPVGGDATPQPGRRCELLAPAHCEQPLALRGHLEAGIERTAAAQTVTDRQRATRPIGRACVWARHLGCDGADARRRLALRTLDALYVLHREFAPAVRARQAPDMRTQHDL
mmetsp:Transcript_7901/g.25906  ORF Transcript_7901/g.25906 Transcript_7901/m.25906 type:complete len:292 (-) Transcript_7901:420-1295(-)